MDVAQSQQSDAPELPAVVPESAEVVRNARLSDRHAEVHPGDGPPYLLPAPVHDQRDAIFIRIPAIKATFSSSVFEMTRRPSTKQNPSIGTNRFGASKSVASRNCVKLSDTCTMRGNKPACAVAMQTATFVTRGLEGG
jgi:hypothetical protein